MTQKLCHDRLTRRVRTSVRDKSGTHDRRARATDFLKFSVMTENSLSRQRMIGLVSQQGFHVPTRPGGWGDKAPGAWAIERLGSTRQRAQRVRNCTRDKPTTVHCVVHCLGSLFYGHCSRTLFMGTV